MPRGGAAGAPGRLPPGSGECGRLIKDTARRLQCPAALLRRIAAAATAAGALASEPHLHHPLQPSNDMDSFVRVVDGQFVVGPSCKRFLVTGWNQ